jgi:membrane-associated PAP2 superfamily phosphatase
MSGGPARRRFVALHLLPALAVVLLLLVMEHTGVDTMISSWFFDPVTGRFPMRYDAAVEIIGHKLARHLVVMAASGVLALYALSYTLPQLQPWRRVLLFMSLGLALAPLSVVLLKALSVRHCPWNVREFGGYADHLTLFESADPSAPPGHCFPGGHASGGFCLLVLYFAGHGLDRPLLRWAGLFIGIAAGLGFGLVRIIQGAHFLSHTLWAGVVCWIVILALYEGVFRSR